MKSTLLWYQLGPVRTALPDRVTSGFMVWYSSCHDNGYAMCFTDVCHRVTPQHLTCHVMCLWRGEPRHTCTPWSSPGGDPPTPPSPWVTTIPWKTLFQVYLMLSVKVWPPNIMFFSGFVRWRKTTVMFRWRTNTVILYLPCHLCSIGPPNTIFSPDVFFMAWQTMVCSPWLLSW